ncbi:unnamed protein product [Hermetia illucens]|uniref:Uncharacterized protein n=1 Tax=Hermetia illucens TaxID=343691 RepID=A0A7R8Z0B7_HERIL|nr:unnamed protein product [Hermetia illucens]
MQMITEPIESGSVKVPAQAETADTSADGWTVPTWQSYLSTLRSLETLADGIIDIFCSAAYFPEHSNYRRVFDSGRREKEKNFRVSFPPCSIK